MILDYFFLVPATIQNEQAVAKFWYFLGQNHFTGRPAVPYRTWRVKGIVRPATDRASSTPSWPGELSVKAADRDRAGRLVSKKVVPCPEPPLGRAPFRP